LQEAIEFHLKKGGELISFEVPQTDHPWLKYAGDLRNDPLLEDWKQAMKDYRNQVDNDLEGP
jgi:hypothetical protein